MHPTGTPWKGVTQKKPMVSNKKKKGIFQEGKKADRGNRETKVRAKKHLGQHFLRDVEIAKRIADTLSLDGYKNVLEIGPGMGVLTRYLLQRDLELVAMDLDADSIVYLKHSFPLEHPEIADKIDRLVLLEADFLKFDLQGLYGNEPFAITGNFPYNISSQIVFKMLEHRKQIPEFSGMFQKEVAQRICEGPGSKAYGILSVLVQAHYHAEYLFTVPPSVFGQSHYPADDLFTVRPSVFDPPPKVDSGVLRLRRREGQGLVCDEFLFQQLVKASFHQRRKTLRNCLKSFGLSDFLKEDGIFDRRPEQLSLADFVPDRKSV